MVGFGAVCSALRQCLADETPTAKEAKFLEAGSQTALFCIGTGRRARRVFESSIIIKGVIEPYIQGYIKKKEE